MCEMNAKFAGTCRACGGAIVIGSRIEWSRGAGARHVMCPAAQASPPPSATPYSISGGSGYGCHGWTVGQVVRAPQRDREQNKYPEWLCVVSVSSRYFREDGMSFGVGDESGTVYLGQCRMATAEEIAPVLARREAAARRKAAREELCEIAAKIDAEGEHPEGSEQISPEGEQIGEGPTAYGGGEWWVLGSEWIWHVRNNGSDGDDWRSNNIRTGGAGAIGHRVPATPEFAQKIRDLIAASSQGKE